MTRDIAIAEYRNCGVPYSDNVKLTMELEKEVTTSIAILLIGSQQRGSEPRCFTMKEYVLEYITMVILI